MMTAKLTAKKVLAAARKRWGQGVQLDERRNAPTKEQKAAAAERRKEIKAESDGLRAELQAIGDPLPALATAARFVADLGQEPDLTQLRLAVERAERHAAIKERRRELEVESKKLPQGYHDRWTLGKVVSLGGMGVFEVVASADTLEELMAKVERQA